MNKLRQSFRRKKDVYVPESSRPHQWQTDEEAVRTGKCSFAVKVTHTHCPFSHTHTHPSHIYTHTVFPLGFLGGRSVRTTPTPSPPPLHPTPHHSPASTQRLKVILLIIFTF